MQLLALGGTDVEVMVHGPGPISIPGESFPPRDAQVSLVTVAELCKPADHDGQNFARRNHHIDVNDRLRLRSGTGKSLPKATLPIPCLMC